MANAKGDNFSHIEKGDFMRIGEHRSHFRGGNVTGHGKLPSVMGWRTASQGVQDSRIVEDAASLVQRAALVSAAKSWHASDHLGFCHQR